MAEKEEILKGELPGAKLKELGVLAIYIFGSYAEGTENEGSDIDIAVLFNDPLRIKSGTNELYTRLYDIFTERFDMSGFKDMDIVFLQRAPLEMAFKIIKDGVILFSSDDDARLEYEDRISLLYKDFQPILRRFDQKIIDR